jgi:hypothetical protein
VSAYHAPSGTVYEKQLWTDAVIYFVTLDGHYEELEGSFYRYVLMLSSGRLSQIGKGSTWDLESRMIVGV